MNRIPDSWALTTVGEITLPVSTVDAASADDREIQYIDIGSIDNERNKIAEPKRIGLPTAPSRARQIVKSGDVLFATVRPYLRNIAQVPDRLNGEIASTGFAVLRPATGVEPGYLYYKAISHDFVSALTGEQYGVSYPAVKDEQVRARPIELPPTNEQRRIVAKIDELFSELDTGVESLITARLQLKAYRQSMLKAAFEGKLIPSKGRDWGMTDVAGITAESQIGIVRSAQQQNTERVGVNYIKMDRIDMDGYVSTEPKIFVEVNNEEIRKFSIRKGDILFNTRNSLELVGKVAVVRSDPTEPTVYNNNLMRIRTVEEALPEFVGYQMCGPEFRRNMERIKKATTSVAAVYGKDLWPLPLVLPDLDMQRVIVEMLDEKLESTREIEAEIEAGLIRAVRLRQSILKRAFSGRLVTQSSVDESASDLLKRISEEREGSSTSRRRRNKNGKREAA